MEDFKQILNTEKPVLVDFYASWCQPCKMQAPILENVKNQVGDRAVIIKVDIDKNQKLAQDYMVQSIPTLILFKNGEPAWRKSGLQTEGTIVSVIEQYENK